MIKFAGLMRVKNEGCFIEESIEALLPLCERVFVMDDHSTDDTVEVCQKFPQVTVLRSEFNTLDESRDKTWLLALAMDSCKPGWVIMVDGDEVLEVNGPDKIRRHISTGSGIRVLSFTVPYYWNDTDHIRVDGSFGKLIRSSAFRVSDLQTCDMLFNNGGYAKHGLHCGNIPRSLCGLNTHPINVALWHYGYMDAATRRRKHDWYSSVDPINTHEDSYGALIQGDEGGPLASVTMKNAGPLKVITTGDLCDQKNFSRRPRE